MSTPFFESPKYNAIGRQQLWLDGCINTHDIWCGCNHPLAHLLSAILPTGHKDRDLTVEELITRSYKEKCRSGGTEETNIIPTTDTAGEEEENLATNVENAFTDDALDELLLAAAADVEPR